MIHPGCHVVLKEFRQILEKKKMQTKYTHVSHKICGQVSQQHLKCPTKADAMCIQNDSNSALFYNNSDMQGTQRLYKHRLYQGDMVTSRFHQVQVKMPLHNIPD
jgi:hypothetical protein